MEDIRSNSDADLMNMMKKMNSPRERKGKIKE